jgi:hypothetical protein
MKKDEIIGMFIMQRENDTYISFYTTSKQEMTHILENSLEIMKHTCQDKVL